MRPVEILLRRQAAHFFDGLCHCKRAPAGFVLPPRTCGQPIQLGLSRKTGAGILKELEGGVKLAFVEQCAGISDQTVAEQTRVAGLVNTAKNSIGCQWLAGGGILGPHFSFTWYRGSPIGRERKTEELSRNSVDDINIEGHNGFVAVGQDPTLGENLCEIAIQYDDDFIEWSISFSEKPFPDPCDVAKELTRQSIVNAK